MDNKKEIVESLGKMLDMLPNSLTEEEKNKVKEIRDMLNDIDKKIDKENETLSMER